MSDIADTINLVELKRDRSNNLYFGEEKNLQFVSLIQVVDGEYEGLLHTPEEDNGLVKKFIMEQAKNFPHYNGFRIVHVHKNHVGLVLHPSRNNEKGLAIYQIVNYKPI